MDTDSQQPDAAALAASVLEEEAKRQAEQAASDEITILPDDLLPGVGDEPMNLKEAVAAGGVPVLLFMFLLNVIDDLPRAIRVVAPDIQDTLNLSDRQLLTVLSLGGLTIVVGAIPMASLSDRVKRVALIPSMSFAWAISLFLTGYSNHWGWLLLGLAVTGLAQSYRIPVSNSMIADSYPIQARAQVFAFEGLGRPIGQLLGPLIVGGIVALASGDEAWRWAFYTAAIPPVIVGVAALVLKEPERGKFDQDAILGEALERAGTVELRASIGSAFDRLKKVKTFYFLTIGTGVLGFALIGIPSLFNLLLDEKYQYGPFTRGVVEALIWTVTLVALPFAGRYFDGVFRADPTDVMRRAGYFIIAAGIIYAIGLWLKPIGPLVVMLALAQACITCAFIAAPMVIAAVSPYRIRSQAFAILPVSIFVIAFVGSIAGGEISDHHGERTAMLVIAPLACVAGGLIWIHGSRYVKRDISVAVEELIEEQSENKRMIGDPDSIPVVQVRNLDFSYGPVQVLFGVDMEVRRGETVALLGTNGAGKSTLLRAISGLGTPDRGVIRLNGRTMTYVEAERRFQHGIVQLRGGSGTFRDLTIGDNLKASLTSLDLTNDEVDTRVARVLEIFPMLDGRLSEKANDLSGGQQQMLALAMALMHEPEVLIIDELSLGLAPVVVQELLTIVEQLRERGQTMVIVEQSVNIALSFSDRAVFMEKGRVRFEGPAEEFAEREDLARAVFLGGEEN